jgi:hypothetical protein
LVVLRAARVKRGVLLLGFGQHCGHCFTVALPEGAQALVEVFNGETFGVADKHVLRNRRAGHRAEMQLDGEMSRAIARGGGHVHQIGCVECALLGEGAQRVGVFAGDCVLSVGHGEVEVTPVNTQVVAAFVEHALVA